jgi:hypothetical protein
MPPPPVPVYVQVSLTGNAGNPIKVDKDPVPVNWANDEEIVWKCNDGKVKVAFNKHGNPFHTLPTTADVEFHSGRVRDHTKASYRYSITVKPNAGGPDVHWDPMVDVDDGTPPGGH